MSRAMAKKSVKKDWASHPEIQYFREYLRIPSVHPKPDYGSCIAFLLEQAHSMHLPLRLFYPANKKNPIAIITWEGAHPELPTILLNSHMDVVPVFAEHWKHPPFEAEIDARGNIYGRGAQDMKCVGMQYLGAIRVLKQRGRLLKRTIHISFVPDEEMGGGLGMRPFVDTDEFRSLNIGFSLDEGIASPTSDFLAFYAERSVWRVYFKISGTSGHGSLLLSNTAGEKLAIVVRHMMHWRSKELKRLQSDPNLTIGDVTTINLTRLNGGVQSNVVPPMLTVCFDCRLAADVDHNRFEATLLHICKVAGGGIELEYDQKQPKVPPTATNESNPFWMAFKRATDEMELNIKLQIFPGGTDSRYIRQVGIPAIGFSPMNNTPVLLHDHDEFINAETYLRGIMYYKCIIEKLAMV